MAKFSLRRFDTQAVVGMWASLAALLSLAGQTALTFCLDKGLSNENVDWSELTITCGPARRAAVLVATAVTLGLATAALGFGFNSAGQRRNEKAKLSWTAFFAGAVVLSLSAIVFLLFWVRYEPPVMAR